jgi:hypothetical protein
VFIICLFFGFGAKVSAATYFVSTAGNNGNNGTSSSTPWANHPWDANATGTAQTTVLHGDDIVYMRRGDIWYDCYLSAHDAGTDEHQITTTSTSTFYKTSSSDPLPKLSGAYDPSTLAWTNDSETIYSTAATTQPNIVIYNDTVLTLDNNTSPALNKWYWVSNVLYVNVGGDPSSGTLEAGKRSWVNLTSKGYQTYSYLEMRVANTINGGVAFNNAQTNVIYDHITIKGFRYYGIYQYNNTGNQVTNCTISKPASGAASGIYSSACSGIIITGNRFSKPRN